MLKSHARRTASRSPLGRTQYSQEGNFIQLERSWTEGHQILRDCFVRNTWSPTELDRAIPPTWQDSLAPTRLPPKLPSPKTTPRPEPNLELVLHASRWNPSSWLLQTILRRTGRCFGPNPSTHLSRKCRTLGLADLPTSRVSVEEHSWCQ